MAEVSPARTALAQAIGGRIARDGGVALVIDYGAWAEGPTGDTLQATRDHGPCDPLDAPGTADLTTHVDFRALALAACDGGAAVYGPVPQGTFLTSFGIHLRTAKLLERAAPAQQRQLRSGAVPSDRPERHGRAVQGRGAGPSGGAGAPRLRRADAAAMLTAAPLEGLAGVRHGFFTRAGGVSEGEFASLNCGYSSGDDALRVETNRARALDRLGMPPASLCTVRQVHGRNVVVAREPQPRRPTVEADALVTDRPGITLGVLSADCAPVLLADPDAGVIGAAHAGWRGARAGVLEATVQAMVELGAAPERMGAAIGPCIAQASYEVGPELLRAFTEDDPDAPVCSSRSRAPTGCASTSRATCSCASRARASRRARRCRTTPTPTRRGSSARAAPASVAGERFGLLLSAIALVECRVEGAGSRRRPTLGVAVAAEPSHPDARQTTGGAP